ncbi:hypothetical protein [Microcoleus sp. herbarium12]
MFNYTYSFNAEKIGPGWKPQASKNTEIIIQEKFINIYILR